MDFTCGNAYLLKCYFTKPEPKDKYAICVCEEKPLLFLINSLPRRKQSPESQLLVNSIDLPFLNHDSYINTAEAITCVIPYTCKVLRDFGSIPPGLKERIKAVTHNSTTLPQRFINVIALKL